MKTKFFMTMALLCMLWPSMKADQVTSFDYSKYTFTWTDSTGVEHTNKLTDKATDPDHILALIAKVYCDKEIPGTWYKDETKPTTSAKIDYDLYAREAANTSSAEPKTSDGYVDYLEAAGYCGDGKTVENPEQEGKTVLFVEIKPTFESVQNGNQTYGIYNADIQSNRDFVKYVIQSVQLVSSFMRVNDTNNGGANPGYMFYIDNISTNRFYYISKGRARKDYGFYPFWHMFEQISPTAGSNATPTTNLAADLKAGKVYKAIHSCGSIPVIGCGHEFTISGSGDLNSFNGLTLYLPDYRLGSANSAYTTKYKPSTFLYQCTLKAEAVPSTKQEGYYTVNLSWDTNFTNDKIGADADEQFYVYVVNEDGTYTLLKESDSTMGETTEELTHSYEVRQSSTTQTIRYIVTANPIEKVDGNITASSIFVNSNVDDVVIPGGEAFFSEASEYRSRFDMDNELNLYKNTVTVTPNTSKDFNQIAVDNPYTLVRAYVDENNVAHKDEVATVQFTQAADALYSGDPTYTYELVYNADAQDTDKAFDDNYPDASKTFTGTLASKDEKIEIVDYFHVSTAENVQPEAYRYILYQGTASVSNECKIPVYKTTCETGLSPVTLDDVKSDINGDISLTADDVYTKFNGWIDPSQNIKRFDMYRYNDKTNIANAQCEGSYITLFQDKKEVDKQQPGISGYFFTANDKLSEVELEGNDAVYVPQITTNVEFDEAGTVTNTYGCNRANVGMPNVALNVTNFIASAKTWTGANGKKYCGYNVQLELTPTVPENAPYVYYYRVWRLNPDGSETLLNTLGDGEYGANYSSTIGKFFPTDEQATTLSVTDVFTNVAPSNDNPDVSVIYVARLYSTNKYNTAASSPLKLADEETANFYVSESTIPVFFNNSVVTGVSDVTAAKNIAGVRYYNALGQSSAQPFAGLNIVVTTYTDGSTSSAKVLK